MEQLSAELMTLDGSALLSAYIGVLLKSLETIAIISTKDLVALILCTALVCPV